MGEPGGEMEVEGKCGGAAPKASEMGGRVIGGSCVDDELVDGWAYPERG